MNILSTVTKKLREISTFDFSTLYTNLPDQDLIWALLKLNNFSIDGGCKDQNVSRKYFMAIRTNHNWKKMRLGYNSYTM